MVSSVSRWMDLPQREQSNLLIFLDTFGPLITFALECLGTWYLHRQCCLICETDWISSPYSALGSTFLVVLLFGDIFAAMTEEENAKVRPTMIDPVKGPFIVVRDLPARESPTSYSSNGNGDSENGRSTVISVTNGNGNGNGVAWIFSELELAVEANPPYIIVDSAYADEVAKNIYRGNLSRIFAISGSIASVAMAFSIQTLPVAVPTLSMTIATAGFYGMFYMKDPAMKYTVIGRKWRTNGFQLSPDHFLYTDQPPLVLKAANSRFRKALRIVPAFLPLVGAGVVVWRFWKVLS